MKRRKKNGLIGVALAAVAVAFAITGTASAHMPKTITIRHQMRGCHAWSFASGPYKASLNVTVDKDTSVVFVNDDVMSHKLLQVGGPRAYVYRAMMNRLGAKATVTFRHTGVYRFTTQAGEDYPWMHEMKTIGEDNVLRLTIKVT
jgi:plastocyanin